MKVVSLADVTDLITDGTHGSPVRTQNGVPVLSAQNVRDGCLSLSTDRFTTVDELHAFEARVKPSPGDVLLTIVGTIGRAALVADSPNAVLQRSVAVIRPTRDVLDPRYLFHVTQSGRFSEQLRRATNQSSQAGVYLGKLKALTLPLPAMDEQRRIAAILDQADALCAKELRAIASVEGLIGSIFQQIFGTQLANAERVALKSLTSVITKGTTPTSVGLSFAESGVPFLRVQNLADGTVKFGPGDLYIDRIAHSKLARSKVQPGDVLISIAGTIGRSAVVPDGAPEMNCNQAVAIVRLSDSSFGRWLMTWLETHDAMRQIKASSVTATISNLSLSQIGALEVPRPETSDVAAFNDRAAAVDAHRLRHQTALAGFACLKDSLVARAFNGSL